MEEKKGEIRVSGKHEGPEQEEREHPYNIE
jgi:hypothetical protein